MLNTIWLLIDDWLAHFSLGRFTHGGFNGWRDSGVKRGKKNEEGKRGVGVLNEEQGMWVCRGLRSMLCPQWAFYCVYACFRKDDVGTVQLEMHKYITYF